MNTRKAETRLPSGIAACQAKESERGSQDSNLESPVLETDNAVASSIDPKIDPTATKPGLGKPGRRRPSARNRSHQADSEIWAVLGSNQ
jgi:hypothetical protein